MSALLETVEVEPQAKAEASIVWLHGLGADGHDFESLVPELRLPAHPAVRFVFPHAPIRPVTINGGYRMRAWYDILALDRQAPRTPGESGSRRPRCATSLRARTSGVCRATASSLPASPRAARSLSSKDYATRSGWRASSPSRPTCRWRTPSRPKRTRPTPPCPSSWPTAPSTPRSPFPMGDASRRLLVERGYDVRLQAPIRWATRSASKRCRTSGPSSSRRSGRS